MLGRWTRALGAAAVGLSTVLAGCAHDSATVPGPGSRFGSVPASISVTSTAFRDGDRIPRAYTCDGAGDNPPIAWSGVRGSARSLAVVVTDPDAPGGTFVHWVVYDIPTSVRSVGSGDVPPGSKQGANSSGRTGWTPPCPPSGTHHYHFQVLALRSPVGLPAGADPRAALAAIARHATARGDLVGTYAHRS